MANNIDITPGAGATVATDEVNGRHYQIVKPAAPRGYRSAARPR